MKSRPTALLATLALVTGAALTAAPAQAAEPTGSVACKTPAANINVNGTSKRLASKFFKLLQAKNTSGLKAFLDPAFYSVDSHGVAKTRSQLVNGLLPNINAFKVSHMHAQLNGSVMTAHYLVLAAGDINGAPYAISAAPRLSTFTFCSGSWQLVSHANFDPLKK